MNEDDYYTVNARIGGWEGNFVFATRNGVDNFEADPAVTIVRILHTFKI